MSRSIYHDLSLDELFGALREAATREYEAFVSGEPISQQQTWAKIEGFIKDEIRLRGDGAMQRYVPLLNDSNPRVRLSAALTARKFAPNLAVPVLEDLRLGNYGGTIATNARMTLDDMRRKGLIPGAE